VAEVHLQCLKAIGQHPIAGVCATADLERIAAHPTMPVPLGLVRDLEHELRNTPGVDSGSSGLQVGWRTDSAVLRGEERPPGQAAAVGMLLVDTRTDQGVVADLTVELVARGQGDFYPAPALAFLVLDQDFQGALDDARAAVQEHLGLSWPSEQDLRWCVQLRYGQAWPFKLVGTSGGLAFGLALVKVLGEWPELELEGVACTAALDRQGDLHLIAGLWEKLGKQAMELADRRLLHTVVVFTGQNDVPLEYLKEDADPLRVIKAGTLADAVTNLRELSRSRQAVCKFEREQCRHLGLLNQTVPIEKHYQVLPLMREVKKERLPKARGPGTRDADGPERNELPEPTPTELLRWEEELRAEAVTYQTVPLDDVLGRWQSVAPEARSATPRLVVLGPPGSGKSGLVQYLAWRAAAGELRVDGRRLVPARVRLQTWERQAPDQSLPDFLEQQYRHLAHAPSVKEWAHWLQRGEVLVLLDGLDEIQGQPGFVDQLKSTFNAYKNCPTVLTCRTVSFEQHGKLSPDFLVFTLAGLSDTQRDAFIRSFPAEHPDHFQSEALIGELDRLLPMRPLAANPLLLAIICYVVDDPHGVSLPATRAALYDKAVNKLLAQPPRVAVAYPNRQPPLGRKRRILERAALALFAAPGAERKLTFDEEPLLSALGEAAKREGYDSNTAALADALLADLRDNSGLLRGDPTRGYFFLHLTLQEFLCASALASLVNVSTTGWAIPITLRGSAGTVGGLVDRKVWDPHWQGAIVLLAGCLNDPAPLIEMLANPKSTKTNPHGDDLFRHRLALAALCLPEIHAECRAGISATIDQITTDAFSLWCKHSTQETEACVLHLAGALPALAQVNGRMDGFPLLDCVLQRLREHDSELHVRQSAVEALGRMGETAASHPGVLPALVQCLRGPWTLHDRAAEAMTRMRTRVVAHPAVLPVLVQWLRDSDPMVRRVVARALGRLGETAAHHPDVLPILVEWLGDPDVEGRRTAVEVLEQMGEVAARQEGVVAQLVQCLRDPDRSFSSPACRAAEALGRMGEAAARHPDVFPALVQRLRDRGEKEVARALLRVSEATARRSEVLPQLEPFLAFDDEIALQHFGDQWKAIKREHTALRGLSLQHLTMLMKDGDLLQRMLGAEELGKRGEAAAKDPAALTQLMQCVLHPEGCVSFTAREALGRLGETAAHHPDVLPTLARWLGDTDKSVREAAALAAAALLGKMGEAAAGYPDVLPILEQCLCDPNKWVRETAALAVATVLGKMGEAAARHPDVLRVLEQCLRDPEERVRRSAARALGTTMRLGVRLFGTESGIEVRWVKELAEISRL
jgi:HEAT repeat protein